MIKHFCDICGREEDSLSLSNYDSRLVRYKVKKQIFTFDGLSWKDVEVCRGCLEKLRTAASKHREVNNGK